MWHLIMYIQKSTEHLADNPMQSDSLLLCRITPALLKAYEEHLRQQGRQWNTISTYLRTLRALYNRGVDRKWAPVAPRLFEHVYTGTRGESKRALSAQEMTRYSVRQTGA